MPALDFVAHCSQPSGCFLPVPDEAVARRIEARRAARNGYFHLQSDLYWFAVERRSSSLQAVLTHADLKLLDGEALDSSGVLTTVSVQL